MKLGIDVGGTNTDAVILSKEGRLLGQAKQATTPDILTGIRQTAAGVLVETGYSPERIQGIFVGTTQMLNALYQGRGLTDTALVRICPNPSQMKPGIGWPEGIARHIKLVEHLAGGVELDGSRRNKIDFSGKIDNLIARLKESGCRAVAIVSTFSSLHHEEEIELAALINRALPEMSVTLSHSVGSIGFLQRENAALLNAMLSNVMEKAIGGLSALFSELGFRCPYWFVQNDGSLMSLEKARAYPIMTIGSGVANSLRGASFLTGLDNCVVVDMGGSTTEVGLVLGGEPQELTRNSKLLGIHVNVRLPKATSLAFGGESPINTIDGLPQREHRLTDVFLQLYPHTYLPRRQLGAEVPQLEQEEAEYVIKRVVDTLRETIDRVQPVKERLPIVLVGGGSPLLVDRLFYKYGETIHPPGFQICNAVGACMAPVSWQIDRIYWLNDRTKEEIVDELTREALVEVERSGGVKDSIRLVQVEEIPFDYYKGEVIRLRVKATGELQL